MSTGKTNTAAMGAWSKSCWAVSRSVEQQRYAFDRLRTQARVDVGWLVELTHGFKNFHKLCRTVKMYIFYEHT